MNREASPTPDWDSMREELIAGHSFEELKRISLAEGARCSHCAKADIAAGIVANRRRAFLGERNPLKLLKGVPGDELLPH